MVHTRHRETRLAKLQKIELPDGIWKAHNFRDPVFEGVEVYRKPGVSSPERAQTNSEMFLLDSPVGEAPSLRSFWDQTPKDRRRRVTRSWMATQNSHLASLY
ncbi:hypothetical protein M407DRAFT_203011 [Tulasnella calospora MUT 4182]|uniref:Uncharacterized protein n=1 Tax=Tulasnella calospora MUT 4182 TaxID=1051891 RepID=A0A0C3LXS2_9AGAM|nr:hypothetical protein M407DRAFT_203011 [Tulasnella calospora MUT 4182]